MAVLLYSWGILWFIIGFVFFAASFNAPLVEIECTIAFLIATLAIGCAAIVSTLDKNRERREAERRAA